MSSNLLPAYGIRVRIHAVVAREVVECVVANGGDEIGIDVRDTACAKTSVEPST